MATVRLILDKQHPGRDGMCSLKVRASVGSETAYLSTGIRLLPSQWEPTLEKPILARKDIANRILEVKVAVQAAVLELRIDKRLPYMTPRQICDEISDRVLGGNTGFPKEKDRVLAYMRKYRDSVRKEGTRDTYSRAIKALEDYGEGTEWVTWEQIDKRWLEAFERHLSATLSVNTISIIMRCIRHVFNDAIDAGVTTSYPFRSFRIRQEETRKRSLSIGELVSFMRTPVAPSQEQWRDTFVLLVYLIGINTVDLWNARWSDIQGDRLHYRRAKTGKLYSIKLEPEAVLILNRWKGERHLLSSMDRYADLKSWRCHLNKRLKAVGQKTGKKGKILRKGPFDEISTYWSRHTWATAAHSLGAPLDLIAQALGHSDRAHSVTMTYIRQDESKVDEINRKVIDEITRCLNRESTKIIRIA